MGKQSFRSWDFCVMISPQQRMSVCVCEREKCTQCHKQNVGLGVMKSVFWFKITILPFAILLRELESEIWCLCHLCGQGMPWTRERFVFPSCRECSTCQLGIWVTVDVCKVRGEGDPLNEEIGSQRPFINSEPAVPICFSEISSK